MTDRVPATAAADCPATAGPALRVVGGTPLHGSVRVAGAKNSVLKLMAAALLAQGRTTLHDVPDIFDVHVMAELLRRLGCEVDLAAEAGVVGIDVPAAPRWRADDELVRAMRASICLLGPLLARTGRAEVALPGGDAIGARGLDLHLGGLAALGAEVRIERGCVVATAARGLVGARYRLEFPSVGATENLLTAAALATGTTVIENAAREPEVVDLCRMLQVMGVGIDGIATDTLEITGTVAATPADHRVVPDRIVAGTWAFAATMTGGDVLVRNGEAAHLSLVLDKLTESGAHVSELDGGFRVQGPARCRAVDVATMPYPGFPTDLQPFVIAMDAVADGSAMVTENLFEARFAVVDQLARLGARVHLDGHHALVQGGARLVGAPVSAGDIRAGAALVVAALVARGATLVHGVDHIDRGYPAFETQLAALGADVTRVLSPDVSVVGHRLVQPQLG